MRSCVDESTPRLLIVGASTRAAAQSARRGGFAPVCIDLYGDADLRLCAEVVTVADMPAEAPAAVARLSGMRWIYCGGLENHPDTVSQLSACNSVAGGSGFRLLGNPAETLTKVRNPWWLAERLRTAGLPMLDVWPDEEMTPPRDGRWLQKPIRGAGGRGISIWNAAAVLLREPHYFQRFISGQSYSAQFLALPGETILLGVTRQLVGLSELHAASFAWCGTLAPASIVEDALNVMEQIGETISTAAGLRGLFGCDFVVEGTTPWLTEVNPRFTAAMELLDYVHQTSLIGWHVRACQEFALECAELRRTEPQKSKATLRTPPLCKGGAGGGARSKDELPTSNIQPSMFNKEVEHRTSNIEHRTSNERIRRSMFDVQRWMFPLGTRERSDISRQSTPPAPPCKGGECAEGRRVFGKIVLFADIDLTIADATGLLSDPCDYCLPFVADVPATGSRIPQGFPVCTLFSASDTEEALVAQLLRRAAEFRDRYLHASDE